MRDHVLFKFLILLLFLLSSGIVWQSRLPPMQDYPQHLMQFHLLETLHDQRYDWMKNFEANIRFAPYAAVYLLSRLFSVFLEIEAVGKAVLTVYFFLLALFAFEASKSFLESPPWGLLLVFPLAFHQFYYFGFINYLLSLPLLFLALHYSQLIANGSGDWRVLLKSVLSLVGLFLAHNYTVLVYIVLGFMMALHRGACVRKALISPAVMATVIGVWTLANFADVSGNRSPWRFSWFPITDLGPFLALPITGMQWTDGVDWLSFLPWIAIISVFGYHLRHSPPQKNIFSLWLVAALLGFVILPSIFGHYSYFNLRLAPVIYFLLAWQFAYVIKDHKTGMLIAILSFFLVIRAGAIQRDVSLEKESILPLFDHMSRNSKVLPLIYDSTSKFIDRAHFYQFSDHDVFYYHVLVGGGGNPALFNNLLMAVRYRPDTNLPYFDKADLSWLEDEGNPYDYIVTRNLPLHKQEYFSSHAKLITMSGPWALYATR